METLGHLGEYLLTVLGRWWILVAGGVLALDPMSGFISPTLQERLREYLGRSQRSRVIMLLACVFIATFFAWQDERMEVEKSRGLPTEMSFEFEWVTELEGGDTITLAHEPMPETVEIYVGAISYPARAEYGLRLGGKKLVVEGSAMMDIIMTFISQDHSVAVKYWRKSD